MQNEIVFVTGATSGFGAAIARSFAEAGARVIAAGRRMDRLTALARDFPGQVHPLELDVRDRDAVARSFDDLPGAFGGVTILVNNAGLGIDRGPAFKASLDDWEAMIDTNVKGLLYCTHAAMGGMIERGRGHIVNIGSVAGRAGGPGSAVYGATKSFVLQFTKNLKSDLIGQPVRATYIAPGAAETEFWHVRWQGNDEQARKGYTGYQPLTADDIARAVLFAVSMPAHVDVTELELMPHAQGFGPRILHRDQ